jgi:predicted dehydrogenase
MSGEVGVAVVGFGLAGRVFHAPFVSAVPGLRLEAIVQRKGDEAAKAYPKTRILRSFEEAIRDPAVQLVVVATPNETHYDLAKRALGAGKHVVVDKPFAATSIQAKELWELAWEKGVVLAPFHNRRWDGDFLTVCSLLRKESVGRLVTYESHFDRFRPVPRENTWKEGADPANGLLFDLGPHLVDQALALFGVPKGITASVRRDRDATEIEDAFAGALPVEHGGVRCCAEISAAWNLRKLQKVWAGPAGACAGGRCHGAPDGRGRVAGRGRGALGSVDGRTESGGAWNAGADQGADKVGGLSGVLCQCPGCGQRDGGAGGEAGGWVSSDPAAGDGAGE